VFNLRVETEVKPSEDRKKVEKALKQIFPTLELRFSEGFLAGESSEPESLERLRKQLQSQAIRDSARKVLRAGRSGNSIRFMLNKQAASVGRVSFTNGESPLGPIVVTITGQNPDLIIDYLAPRTREGESAREIKAEEMG